MAKHYVLDDRDLPNILTSAQQAGDVRYVNVSGDTMTGGLAAPSVSADYIQINKPLIPVNVGPGQIAWNDKEQTFDMGLENGSVLQAGQEFLILVHNETGADIPDGRVVYVTSGSDDGVLHIALASSTNDSAYSTIAVTTQTVYAGGSGYVTKIGKVRDLDTSDIPTGKIYLGHNGLFTNTEPSYPEHSVEVGYCVVQHATSGVIFVDITRQYAVEDLYNVAITNPQAGDSFIYENNQWINRNFGAITKESTGFAEPENVSVVYNQANRTITLSGSNINAYWRSNLTPISGTSWTSPAHSVGVSGNQFLYYDGTNFVWSSTAWTYDMLQIALVNYDRHGNYVLTLRECHGTMPWQAHREFHQTIGCYLVAGGDLSNYTLNSTVASARRPYVSQTTVADEDLWTVNNQLATNSYALISLSGSNYRAPYVAQTDIIRLSGSQPMYVNYTGGNWVETLVPNNNYVVVYVMSVPAANGTQSQSFRYMFIQPQTFYSTLAAAQAANTNSLNLGDSTNLLPEFVFIGKIIIQYTAGDWQISEVSKLTGTKVSQSTTTGAGLTSVTHDSTLSGAGTASSPLGIAASLDNLTDVQINTPVNGNGLVYVSAINQWEAYGNMYAYDDVAAKFYQKEGKWDSTTTTVSANSAAWATVTHDSTLSGTGALNSPLGVVGVFDTYKVKTTSGDSEPLFLESKLSVDGGSPLTIERVDGGGHSSMYFAYDGRAKNSSLAADYAYIKDMIKGGNGIGVSADNNSTTIYLSATAPTPELIAAEGATVVNSTASTSNGTVTFYPLNVDFGDVTDNQKFALTDGLWHVEVKANAYRNSNNVLDHYSFGCLANGGTVTSSSYLIWSDDFGSNVGTDTTKVEINKTGTWQINFNCNISKPSNSMDVRIFIRHYNSSNTLIRESVAYEVNLDTTTPTSLMHLDFSKVWDCTNGDYFKVYAQINSLGAADVRDYYISGSLQEDITTVDSNTVVYINHHASNGTIKKDVSGFVNAVNVNNMGSNVTIPYIFSATAGDYVTVSYSLYPYSTLDNVVLAGHEIMGSSTGGGGGVSDGKVKVTASDTADYLANKLIAGTGMTISNNTSSVTLSVDPPQDALQTFTISMATGQGGTFDGSYSHITALYVPYSTTVDRMACYVTQTAGNGNIYLAIYDSSYNKLCQTTSFTPSAIGVISVPMMSACSLTKNQRYYFYVGGDANGCQLLLAGGMYASNEPFLAKEDQNQVTPPTTFNGGSSDSKRFWIIAYKN